MNKLSTPVGGTANLSVIGMFNVILKTVKQINLMLNVIRILVCADSNLIWLEVLIIGSNPTHQLRSLYEN